MHSGTARHVEAAAADRTNAGVKLSQQLTRRRHQQHHWTLASFEVVIEGAQLDREKLSAHDCFRSSAATSISSSSLSITGNGRPRRSRRLYCSCSVMFMMYFVCGGIAIEVVVDVTAPPPQCKLQIARVTGQRAFVQHRLQAISELSTASIHRVSNSSSSRFQLYAVARETPATWAASAGALPAANALRTNSFSAAIDTGRCGEFFLRCLRM